MDLNWDKIQPPATIHIIDPTNKESTLITIVDTFDSGAEGPPVCVDSSKIKPNFVDQNDCAIWFVCATYETPKHANCYLIHRRQEMLHHLVEEASSK